MRIQTEVRIFVLSAVFFLSNTLPSFSLVGTPVITRTDCVSWSGIGRRDIEYLPASQKDYFQLIRVMPSLSDQRMQQQDLLQAKTNLSSNLNDLETGFKNLPDKTDPWIREFMQNDLVITRNYVDQFQSLLTKIPEKPANNLSPTFTFGQQFVFYPKTGALNYDFSTTEQSWLKQNIPAGRLGLGGTFGDWAKGYSAYNATSQQWFRGPGLGETYGFGGSVIAFGKTPRGPALAIFDSGGVHVGTVTPEKLKYDFGITAKYLLQAGNSNRYNFFNSLDKVRYGSNPLLDSGSPTPGFGQPSQSANFNFNNNYSNGLIPFQRQPSDLRGFNPYAVMVPPLGMSYGDMYQTADILNNRLLNFRGSYNEGFFNDFQERKCPPVYAIEPVFPRSVLKETAANEQDPNDPFYYKPEKKNNEAAKSIAKMLITGALRMGGEEFDATVKKGPEVEDQYGIRKIGYLPKSDANSAWNFVDANTKNVLVAVIDSGLDLSHPDGPQYIWTNQAEIPDNGLDDDGDGYVDDVHGWNFLDENNDLTDYRGHGTMVAGIIAAKANNGIGIAGINPGAVIMPLKVADKFGNTNSLNIYRAIEFAVSHGAKVINISLGSRGVSRLEQLAINHARSLGTLVVVASGNDGENIGLYGPASQGQALVVGAVNYDGTRSTVSNWGPNNALMAPGEEIYSLQSKDAKWEGAAANRDRKYTKASGTSFSAPMVAATVSLLLVKDPTLQPDQLEDILASTATRMADDAWEAKTGAGVVNATQALKINPGDVFNVKLTGLKVMKDEEAKKVEAVDVFATVRGARLDYFTVELGKGQNPGKFQKLIGFYRQSADHDLVAHIDGQQLRGSLDWVVLIRAVDQTGKEFIARSPLVLK